MAHEFGFSCYGRFDSSLRLFNEHIFDDHTKGFLDAVLFSAPKFSRRIETNTPLWRAQQGCDYTSPDHCIAAPFERDRMLPNSSVGGGRANKDGKPVFYGATKEKLAINETRPWKGQRVSVALFELERARKVLDLATPVFRPAFDLLDKQFGARQGPPTPEDYEHFAWSDIAAAFSRPVARNEDARDYLSTQVLTELFRSCGYEGILFRSSVTPKNADLQDVGYNVVLFSYDKLILKWQHVVEVLGVDVEFKETFW